MLLADRSWSDVQRGVTVVVPVGSFEQHGPHLPFDTDAVIASAVGARVADHLGAALLPSLMYGSSGEHQSFAGTVSIGAEALRLVIVELVRSLRTWAGRIVLVNGHGGNAPALAASVAQLVAEGHEVGWVPCEWISCTPDGLPWDAHAGRSETSLMLHLDPDRVDLTRAEVGNTTPVGELMAAMMAGGVAAVAPNGVLGDPTGASAEEGEVLLASMVAAALDRLGDPPHAASQERR